MPSEKLKKLFDMAVTAARKDFELTGEVPTVFIMEKPDGMLWPVSVLWGSNEEKEVKVHFLRFVMKQFNIQRYVMFTEMWFSTVDMPKGASVADAYKQPRPMPSQDPNRREGIVIYGEERGSTESISGMIEIIRPKIGKARLSELKHETEKFETLIFGRMLNDAKPN